MAAFVYGYVVIKGSDVGSRRYWWCGGQWAYITTSESRSLYPCGLIWAPLRVLHSHPKVLLGNLYVSSLVSRARMFFYQDQT